jgi:iron complex transport system ATP-binding protein
MDAVALDAVEVRRSGRRIFGPVTWKVTTGERWAVLGPNGSGKTTLLSVAGAWLHPSSGRAQILGCRMGRFDVRDLRTRIGQVSHRLTESMPPHLTVEQIVLTGRFATLAPWPDEVKAEDRARAGALLATVGCAPLSANLFTACSQGERQRVLLARALMTRPELVVLDEPAAGLDLPGRETVIAALEAAGREHRGASTILATHHLDEIPPSTSHAALLREGRLLHAGRIDDVLTGNALRDCFGIDLRVERRAGRWFAFAGR